MRVCGEILANAVTNRLAFAELLDRLRQQRQNGDPDFAPQLADPLEDAEMTEHAIGTGRPSSDEEGASA